jgi:hypothetical protein
MKSAAPPKMDNFDNDFGLPDSSSKPEIDFFG